MTVKAIPGSGGTMTIEESTSPIDEVHNGTASWDLIPEFSAVSVNTIKVFQGPVTALRVTAATANGVVEIVV